MACHGLGPDPNTIAHTLLFIVLFICLSSIRTRERQPHQVRQMPTQHSQWRQPPENARVIALACTHTLHSGDRSPRPNGRKLRTRCPPASFRSNPHNTTCRSCNQTYQLRPRSRAPGPATHTTLPPPAAVHHSRATLQNNTHTHAHTYTHTNNTHHPHTH